jgi:DNA modification methylase
MEIDKIYQGDCLELIKQLPDKSIDCIICDPPYEVLNKNNKDAQWDRIIPLDELWQQYERVAKDNAAIILFAQGMFTARLMMSNPKLWRYNLIWQKGGRCSGFLNAKKMPLREHEDIVVFYRKQPTYNPQMTKCNPYERNHSRGRQQGEQTNRCYGEFGKAEDIITDLKYPKSILNFNRPHPQIHPTQKPVALIQYLIKTFSNENDLILDNCIGSGTTAVAAIKEKRHFIGMELNKEYYDIACKRVKEAKMYQTLF